MNKKQDKDDIRAWFYLPVSVVQRLQTAAATRGQSASEILAELIITHVPEVPAEYLRRVNTILVPDGTKR